MAVDDAKLAYSSEWEIDQIIDYQDSTTNPNLTLAVPGIGPAVVIVDHTYGHKPYILPQYKPDTQGKWYEPGENLQFSTSQLVTCDVWTNQTTIVFSFVNNHASTVNVEIRYWVLPDDSGL